MTALLLHLIIVYYKKHAHYSIILLFSVYTLCIALISTDVSTSLINTIKIIIPMCAILIGFHFFNSKERIKFLAKSMNITLLILVLNFILSNIFSLGSSTYTEEEGFLMGQLSDNWNVFTYSILTVPVILHYKTKRGKWKTAILASFTAILVILSIKRIAIIGLLGGGLINLFLTLKTKRIIQVSVLIVLIMVVTYPIYGKLLSSRFEARSTRFEDGGLEKEARYLETFYVWEDVFSLDPFEKSLFGMEGFNSAGNYANGKFGDRQLHVDYNNIVNTVGLVGLILYLTIFVQLWRRFKSYTAKIEIHDKFSQTMKGVFYTFFIIQFVTSFAGQMYNITFRLILFIFIGASMGYFYQLSLKKRHESIDH